VRLDELPAYREEDPIPLTEAGKRSPGQFECTFDVLVWRPPHSDTTGAQIELLNAAGTPMPVKLAPLGASDGGPHRFQITGAMERPSFGRLHYSDGTTSAPAIVSLVDMLRETVREARSKKAEFAAVQLSEETEEGLWLWEVLNELEAAELAQSSEASPGAKRPQPRGNESEAHEQHRKLPYDQFIAGRRLRSDEPGTVQNSLAGSELSLVRAFLNRILTIGDQPAMTTLDDEAVAKALNLGDETADAAAALEQGEEFTDAPDASQENDAEEEAERRRAARARASREQIVQAVAKFSTRLREKAEARQISSFDVLRLRAMLMIIAAAGQSLKPTSKPTAL
jgi:hypothetical protein